MSALAQNARPEPVKIATFEAVVVAEFGPRLGESRAHFLIEGIQPLGALLT
jgi:hypothetical protein